MHQEGSEEMSKRPSIRTPGFMIGGCLYYEYHYAVRTPQAVAVRLTVKGNRAGRDSKRNSKRENIKMYVCVCFTIKETMRLLKMEIGCRPT